MSTAATVQTFIVRAGKKCGSAFLIGLWAIARVVAVSGIMFGERALGIVWKVFSKDLGSTRLFVVQNVVSLPSLPKTAPPK